MLQVCCCFCYFERILRFERERTIICFFFFLFFFLVDDETKKGAFQFQRYLDTQTRDLRPEILPKFFSELIQHIAGFIKV